MGIPSELTHVLATDPQIISGAVRFRGTRVPVQALLDSLMHGSPVSDFLEGFPDVTEQQAQAVVAWEQKRAREFFGLEAVT